MSDAPPMTNPTLLLIGAGAPLRKDDGVGPLLVERLTPLLRQAGVETRTLSLHQLAPETAHEVAREDVTAVVFVDARSSQDEDEFPHLWELFPDEARSSTSHAFSASTVLAIAAQLYGRRPRAWLLTIPGYDFGFGDSLSPRLAALVARPQPLANLILQALGKEAG